VTYATELVEKYWLKLLTVTPTACHNSDMTTGHDTQTIANYTLISGRAVEAYDAAPRTVFASYVVTDDLVTVSDTYGTLTAWVLGVQDSAGGYVTLVLDTPGQPTYWAMRKDDSLTREGHDYTDFANAWGEAQAATAALYA
jgi:hypothetical protein